MPFITILAFLSVGGCALLGAMWFVDHQKLQAENDRLQVLVIQQTGYKSDLQEMLDASLNSSNELVTATDTLSKEIAAYKTLVESSFRYLNGNVEVLPGANGKVLQDSQDQVEIELDNTEAKIQDSIKQKDEINNKINEIFGASNQNLQNRADPRDGARNPIPSTTK